MGHGEEDLARNTQRLPAGCQYREVGTPAQQRLGEGGAGVYQVLAIIKDEEGVPGPEVFRKRFEERDTRRLADPEHRGNSLRHEVGIGERGELDQSDHVLEPSDHVGSHREGEAGLA